MSPKQSSEQRPAEGRKREATAGKRQVPEEDGRNRDRQAKGRDSATKRPRRQGALSNKLTSEAENGGF